MLTDQQLAILREIDYSVAFDGDARDEVDKLVIEGYVEKDGDLYQLTPPRVRKHCWTTVRVSTSCSRLRAKSSSSRSRPHGFCPWRLKQMQRHDRAGCASSRAPKSPVQSGGSRTGLFKEARPWLSSALPN